MFARRAFASPAARRVRAAGRIVRRAVARRALPLWSTARRAWRSSLQLRIVTITLVTSGALVGAFGLLLASAITTNLLDDKRDEALKRVDVGAAVATSQLSVITQRGDPDLRAVFTGILSLLASRPEQGESGVVVALLEREEPTSSITSVWPDDPQVVAAAASAITADLRRDVSVEWQVAHQHRTVKLSGQDVQYLVYGAPVPTNWGNVELYYLFPLAPEVAAAESVRQTVIITGVALVVLLALIAALVTRLVVHPVRLAARTAQRLSAGLLDQRMEVRGEDELALLGASFNQMAANLQRQIQRLEEMSRLQRRFTSDVSHELRTPLTTVRMAADLIFAERDGFDPAVGRSAELLQAELDRFEALLTDLLEISRFDAGFAVLDAEPTDLVAIVRRVVEHLAPLAERAGVPVELDLPDTPVIVELDGRRVERVLRNLVGNAVEHAEARPVRVAVAAHEGAVAVTVRDHGIGLSPGEEKLVFNRFWRADPSRARQTGGTGLGLSISLEDARLHGGWLEAWGAPEQGAQFRLTLPLRTGDRLVSSPLPLVPDDAYTVPAPRAALPAPITAAAALPAPAAPAPAAPAPAELAGSHDA